VIAKQLIQNSQFLYHEVTVIRLTLQNVISKVGLQRQTRWKLQFTTCNVGLRGLRQ